MKEIGKLLNRCESLLLEKGYDSVSLNLTTEGRREFLKRFYNHSDYLNLYYTLSQKVEIFQSEENPEIIREIYRITFKKK